MVELLSFLIWETKVVIGHKTLSLPNGKIMVNHIWCKVCAAHKNDIVNQLKGNAKQSAQAFIQGTNVVNKHQVWIFSVFFLRKTMKFQKCLISIWNGSSQLKLFYNVFCYIFRYSLTLISPQAIRHLGGQAHNIAVELEWAKPNNEKAVPKKALPSTLNQPRIDHVCDKNMREGYIKLFRTAYTLAIEPTLPLSRFKTVKMQRENGVRLIQGEY